MFGNLVLECRRKQHVAVELEGIERVRQVGGPRKVQYRSAGSTVLSDRVGVEASCIGNGALSLRDSDDERPRFAAEPRCPVAHVAESLHDDPLAVETNWQT